MGCDIHFHVEFRNSQGHWFEIKDTYDSDDDENWLKEWARPDRWYHGSNYYLFAILADVRNGRGFGGVKTGEGFNPISPPRGLPDNVSQSVKRESDEWGVDGHSHSWLTVGEVLAFDWDQMATLTGLFWDYGPDRLGSRQKGEPGHAKKVQEYADTYYELPPWAGSYCGGVGGPGADEFKRVTWQQPYWRCAGDEWWATVARAAGLAKVSSDERVEKLRMKAASTESTHEARELTAKANAIAAGNGGSLDLDSVRFVFWFDN